MLKNHPCVTQVYLASVLSNNAHVALT